MDKSYTISHLAEHWQVSIDTAAHHVAKLLCGGIAKQIATHDASICRIWFHLDKDDMVQHIRSRRCYSVVGIQDGHLLLTNGRPTGRVVRRRPYEYRRVERVEVGDVAS